MITQARPFFHSLPVPVAKAMGSMPKTMAMVVMRMGRRRVRPASTKAST